jgi:hypothetical protein
LLVESPVKCVIPTVKQVWGKGSQLSLSENEFEVPFAVQMAVVSRIRIC